MENKKKFYKSTWFIVVSLFLFAPLGIFLIWKYKRFNLVLRSIFSIVFGIIFIMVIIPSSSENTNEKSIAKMEESIQENQQKEDESNVKSKVELTNVEENLLKKSYNEFSESERTDFASILEKVPKLDIEVQNNINTHIERLKIERDEWVEEQKRIAEEQEQKEWEEFVAKNTKTLSAGEHFVGKHIDNGVYDVTFPKGSGNFMAYSSEGELLINEIGGKGGILKFRAILPLETKIELKGINAKFIPVKTIIKPYEELELYAGYWIVGQDLTKGRYKITSKGNDSGNFMVYSKTGSLRINEILGGNYGVQEVVVNLIDGDLIKIGALKKVIFIPEE